jgi:hypothetical protein
LPGYKQVLEISPGGIPVDFNISDNLGYFQALGIFLQEIFYLVRNLFFQNHTKESYWIEDILIE